MDRIHRIFCFPCGFILSILLIHVRLTVATPPCHGHLAREGDERTRPCPSMAKMAMAHCRAVREPPLQHALLPPPLTTPVASAPAPPKSRALFPARLPSLVKEGWRVSAGVVGAMDKRKADS